MVLIMINVNGITTSIVTILLFVVIYIFISQITLIYNLIHLSVNINYNFYNN